MHYTQSRVCTIQGPVYALYTVQADLVGWLAVLTPNVSFSKVGLNVQMAPDNMEEKKGPMLL